MCLVEAPAKGGAGTRNIWLGGSLVAVVSDGQTWCLMADALGSVVAVTNPAGQAIKRNHYKPFGEARTEGAQLPSVDSAGFVGGLGVQADASTGLSYMWHRYFDAEVTGFMTVDPISRDIPGWCPNRHQYGYVANNPLRFIDPTGLEECEMGNRPKKKKEDDAKDAKPPETGCKDVDCCIAALAVCRSSCGSVSALAYNKCIVDCGAKYSKCVEKVP